jgi:hypothetical protein
MTPPVGKLPFDIRFPYSQQSRKNIQPLMDTWLRKINLYNNKEIPIPENISFDSFSSLQDPYRIRDFEPYIKNPFINLVYKIYKKNMIIGCIIFSFFLSIAYILPFYINGGLDYLIDFNSRRQIGALQSTSFISIWIVCIGLIYLDYVFKQYHYTFFQMRNRIKVKESDYIRFIRLNNWSLQSPSIYYWWILFSSGAVLFFVRLYLFPTSQDLLDNIGLVGFLIILVIQIIIWINIISICWYLFSMVRTIRRYCLMPLDLRPLDPDNAAGLRPLASLSFKISLFTFLGIMTFFYSIFLGMRSVNEIFMLCVFILLLISMIILFILPLANAHDSMLKVKQEILETLSNQHYKIYLKIKNGLPKENPCIPEAYLTDLEGLSNLYDKSNSMPVWPFDINILSQFLIAFITPIIITYIQTFLI